MRLTVLAFLAALCAVCAGCPAPTTTLPAPRCDPGIRVCDSDRDCPGAFDGLSFCDDHCCVSLPNCRADSDCATDELCVSVFGGMAHQCQRLACEPLFESSCEPHTCLVEHGTPSCGTPPVPTSCTIAANGAVVVADEPLHVDVAAFDTEGRPVPSPLFDVAPTDLVVDRVLRAPCPGPDECVVHIIATAGSISCAGDVRIEPVDATKTRVAVSDENRAPLANVRIDARIDGAFVSVDTDAHGLASVDGIADLITIAPIDRDWTTVLAPSPVTVVVAPSRPSASFVQGVTGSVDFSNDNLRGGDLQVGFVGFAQPSLVDLDLQRMLGVPRKAHVDIEGLTPSGGVDDVVPSVLDLSLGDTVLAGPTLAFGDRAAYVLGARIDLASAPLVIAPGGAIDLRPLLRARSIPLVHGEVLGLHTIGGPAPPPDAPIAAWQFENAGFAPNTRALESVSIHADALPANTTDLLAAAFVRTPDAGFLLLGVADVFDDDGDGRVSDFDLDLAPPHDGLEGNPVTVVVAALDLDSVTLDAPYSAPASVRFVELTSFDPIDATSLIAPPSSQFDGASFTSTNDVARVDLTGPAGSWHVYNAASFDVTALTADQSGLDRSSTARAIAFAATTTLFASSSPLDDSISAFAAAQSN